MNTIEELDRKIRMIAPEWMIAEADELINIAEIEQWEDMPQTIMDCWDRLY